MARINIEDSIFADVRFLDLVHRKGGDVDTALGALVRAWSIAQKHFLTTDNDRLIPLAEWKKQRLSDEIIDVGLAERREKGIYLCGAETQFSWLLQRQSAGKKPKAKAKKRPLTTDSTRKRDRTGPNGSNPPSPSSLLLPLSSSNTSQNPSDSSKAESGAGTAGEGGNLPTPPEVLNPVGLFIARYVKAYQARYGAKARPDLRGKTQGQIRDFLDEVPLERACLLIETYCAMNDQWFITKAHDFGTFIANVGKVGLRLDTGRAPTTTEARQAEKTTALQDQLNRIAEGRL